MYWRRRLTRLELALYAIVVGAALAALLDRMLDTMELAERVAMEVTVSRVNSAITTQLASDRLGGRLTRLSELRERNPFEVAGMVASNSHGELDTPRLADLERGYWVFDRSRKELIYLPRLHRGLRTADADSNVHFRLVVRESGTLVLVPVSPYSWQPGA